MVSFNSLIVEMRKLQPFQSSAFSFVMWGVWARFSLSTKGCPLNKTKAQVCTDFQLMPLFTSHLLALMDKPGGKWVDVERAVRMYTVASGVQFVPDWSKGLWVANGLCFLLCFMNKVYFIYFLHSFHLKKLKYNLQCCHYFISSVQFHSVHSVVSSSLRPHGLQHARPP